MSDVPSYDERNGDREMPPGAPRKPTLTIVWDAERQDASLQQVDISQFRTWDFIIACLEMAKSKAEFSRNMSRAAAMQKQQMEEIGRQQEAGRLAERLASLKH